MTSQWIQIRIDFVGNKSIFAVKKRWYVQEMTSPEVTWLFARTFSPVLSRIFSCTFSRTSFKKSTGIFNKKVPQKNEKVREKRYKKVRKKNEKRTEIKRYEKKNRREKSTEQKLKIPVLFFPVFFPPTFSSPTIFRTCSKVTTFEIQRFKIPVSCFSSTCRYITVHVPCWISFKGHP
jgi:hypothetical protein